MRIRWVAVAVFVLGSSGLHAAKLNMPGDAVGLWVGGCTQRETQVHTSITGNIQQSSDTLLLGFFHNNDAFFGCPPEDHGGYPLFKNQKPNGWTPHAIRAHPKFDFDDLLGPWVLKTKGTNVKFKGKNACNGQGPKSYVGKGALANASDLTIAITAKLQSETVHFDCSWHKFG